MHQSPTVEKFNKAERLQDLPMLHEAVVYWISRGFSIELAMVIGLRVYEEAGRSYLYFPDLKSRSKAISGDGSEKIIARIVPDGSNDEVRYTSTKGVKGGSSYMANYLKVSSGTVSFCEGIMDALASCELGRFAISIGGVGSVNKITTSKSKKVIYLPQNDDRAKVSVEKAKAIANDNSINLKVEYTRNEYMDLSELYSSFGPIPREPLDLKTILKSENFTELGELIPNRNALQEYCKFTATETRFYRNTRRNVI